MIDLEEKLSLKFNGKKLFMYSMHILITIADGSDYTAFLDSGYALGSTFITPFSRRRVLSAAEKSFNS